MGVKYVFILTLLYGTVCGQSDLSISDAIDSLPPELQGKVDDKQIEVVRNKSSELFKEKCLKNGGAEAFDKAENAFRGFTKCISVLVNTSTLQQEIEKAKPTGQVDEVFKKYCKKTPAFKDCFYEMTEAVKTCFPAEERKNLKTVYNVSEQLAEFVCYKEGDRIALFIAEGGPECFQEKQELIQQCVNSTYGDNVKFDPNNITADRIPKIAFGEKECMQMTKLQKCMVQSLETCAQPTSANIVDSLFKFVRGYTPCVKYEEKGEKKDLPDSANGLAVTSATIIMVAVTTLLV